MSPYIDPEARKRLETHFPRDPGELTYELTVVVNNYLKRRGLRYAYIAEVLGSLEATKLEIYRRVVAPYEDGKIQANGDVYTAGRA